MRVLHFYKTARPDSLGGVEQVIDQLARGTARRGVQVDVLSLADSSVPSHTEHDGYAHYRVQRDFEVASTGFSVGAFSRFRELAHRADVIHYHFPWPFADVVHFASRIGKPTVLTYHSDIVRQKLLRQLYAPLMKQFLGSMDTIVATSPNYVASSEVLRHLAHKVKVIPIGLDPKAYARPSDAATQAWRAELPPQFFLFVGVLRYYKGLHILLEAAAGTDIPILIAGSGPIENELKTKAAALGLANVRFLGFLSEVDKAAMLELCTAVVFPSHLRSEAFGISLLEGAMFGKPMISSEIGTGTSFINLDGETGIVTPPSDAAALRTAMMWLLNNSEEAAAMGRRAQSRFRAVFTLEPMVQAYLDIYDSVVAGS